MAESAFRLFDRDLSGLIEFREFCCGLSIICLSSTNEKIRFIFDMFDIDRDGYLNKQEFRVLLETSIMSFRKFCKGHYELVDKSWIDHHLKLMIKAEPTIKISDGILPLTQLIDFLSFKKWAECSLNVHHLLNTFMLVPSPVMERKSLIEILQQYERKHGDTMYALSFRWWESWKEYTSKHQSTKD